MNKGGVSIVPKVRWVRLVKWEWKAGSELDVGGEDRSGPEGKGVGEYQGRDGDRSQRRNEEWSVQGEGNGGNVEMGPEGGCSEAD